MSALDFYWQETRNSTNPPMSGIRRIPGLLLNGCVEGAFVVVDHTVRTVLFTPGAVTG